MEPARWSVWDLPAALVPMNYIEHVQRAGGLALLIPPDPALVDDPGRVLDRVDGLLLVGGADLGADTYGAEPHHPSDEPIPLRDAVEIALVRAAQARGLPVLGICRGAQVINVAGGGTLRQHIPDELGHEEHRRAIGRFAGNEHDVTVEPGSRALEATGESPHRVASHHHQGIAALGGGLRVTARAAGRPARGHRVDPGRLGPGRPMAPRGGPRQRGHRGAGGRGASKPAGGRGSRRRGRTSRSPPLAVTNGADPVGSALHPARPCSLPVRPAPFLGRRSSVCGLGFLPRESAAA